MGYVLHIRHVLIAQDTMLLKASSRSPYLVAAGTPEHRPLQMSLIYRVSVSWAKANSPFRGTPGFDEACASAVYLLQSEDVVMESQSLYANTSILMGHVKPRRLQSRPLQVHMWPFPQVAQRATSSCRNSRNGPLLPAETAKFSFLLPHDETC